jgi:S1-C subfamily serine protease
MLTIWSGVQHGRNSGISFVVPWGAIQRALPSLQAGRSPARGYAGVRFSQSGPATLLEVVPGSPAAKAGLAAGDVVVGVERERVHTAAEALSVLGSRWEGDRVRLALRRDGRTREAAVVLGARPNG